MNRTRLTRADWGWLAMVAGILAYEVSAPEGQLLSHGMDRYLERHPWATRAVVSRWPGTC